MEKILCPQKDKLKVKEGTISAKIIDEELDIIDCTFNNDRCVNLDTEKYTYLVLSVKNLHTLINLIEAAENKYDKIFKSNKSTLPK